MRSRLLLACALTSALVVSVAAQAAPKRPVQVGDIYRMREVRDPQLSPDGNWVAYTVVATDSARDQSDADVWMTSWDGTQSIRLTSTPENETAPRWSPDGRYLAFLSGRMGSKGGQVWLLDRRGGEASSLTAVKGGVSSYDWSPDGQRLVLVIGDADAEERDSTTRKTPKPIVIDRYTFKRDVTGYLGAKHQHIYLFDVAAKKLDTLTSGPYDDDDPAFSPDGRWIAFQSKRGPGDVDRSHNTDVFVIEAKPGATPRQVTTSPKHEGGPFAWSPDGKWLAFLVGGDPKYAAYNVDRLAVVSTEGGAGGESVRVLTEALDRPVSTPHWSADGKSLLFTYADDRARHLGRVGVDGGQVEVAIGGRRVVAGFSTARDGKIAVLSATATQPPEIFALDGTTLRQLSHHNDTWLGEVQLGTTEDISFKSRDGTEVHGLLVKPASYVAGRKYPTLLRIHGGPNGQDQHEFNLERELFAANGYVVIAVNYRGSAGRGEKYGQAIFADWGNKEVMDLLAGVDYVVSIGVADPERLGIGGWSYGGILTNYTIASDHRFKAATSGAGSSMQIAMYGTDQYTVQYDNELGPPWKSQGLWIRLSYPFFHADRINTPTLFLGGERDFNVPLLGGEQMYQALRTLNVDTKLVVYPNQFHGISLPSFKRDRLERYLSWYDKYLKSGFSAVQAGRAGA